MSWQHQQHQQHQHEVSDAQQHGGGSDFSLVLVHAGTNFVKRHPRISISYVAGLLLCVFATGLTPSPDAERRMGAALDSIDATIGPQLQDASIRLSEASHAYQASRGWFWRCDDRCQYLHSDFLAAQDAHKELEREFNKRMAEANAHVGVFSTFGVQRARGLFWRMFGHGKDFGKRQTMWDALFMGIGGMARDESLIEFGLRLMLSMLVNFTIGLFGAFVAFVWNLWALVTAFGADLFTGAAFFALATMAAGSFCVSWILGLYGAAAGTVYVVGVAAHQQALEGGRRGPPRQLRSHYD